MNICIVGDSIRLQSAGSLVSTQRFAKELSLYGDNITMITTDEKESCFLEDGIKIYNIKAPKTPFLEGSWRCKLNPPYKKIKEIFIKENIDILYFVVPTPLCFTSIKIAKKLDIPIVSHFHTQPENLTTTLKMRFKLINWLIYKYSLFFYNKSNILICPSKFAEEKIKKYSDSVKTVVISNGVNLKVFHKKPVKDFYEKFNIPIKTKKILFVGRLWKDKNVSILIKSMKRIVSSCPDAILIIVGKKEREYNNLKKLSEKIGLKDKIFFLGRVELNDLVNAYNSCDLFCLPSICELEGMVVLEAMACGKPIVVSNSPETASKYFVKGNGFVFNLDSFEDLSNKILKILSNNKLEKKMGEKSLEIAKKMDIEKSVIKLRNIFKSLV